jgi:chromosome segregation ATPase
LNALKVELGRLSPEIAKLQADNRVLSQKIDANQTRINNSNVQTQILRRDALQAEVSGVQSRIQSNASSKAGLEAQVAPTLKEIEMLNKRMQDSQRVGNMAEVARIRAEIERVYGTIAPQRNEINRLGKENEQLSASIAPKVNEINSLNTSITNNQNTNTALQNEIDSARTTIASNDRIIAERSQANAGLAQQIADLEKEVNALDAQRNPTAQRVATLKQQETALTALSNTLRGEIQRLEAENQKLTVRIAEMDKAILELPQNLRQNEAQARKVDETVMQKRSEIDREQRLLARIRQDRMTVEQELNRAQAVLDTINYDLSQSERLIATLRNQLNEESRNRDALTRYNQDSIRKLEALRAQKNGADQDVAGASEEIKINDQDIATIASELPKLRSDLTVVTPKVVAALNARNTAQKNSDDANSQYQNRLALYQSYLAQSQKLGEEKAQIGTADGSKAGSVEGKAKGNKLASENAAAEAKWDAIRRGYIRGEIAGFTTGFDIGMASTPDAAKGEADGKVAGARRAKDHANLVIKPEVYLEELERRLKDDETSQKGLVAMVQQEVSNIQSMARALEESIPSLSQAEINDAAKIVSSLDSLIEQSALEIKEVLSLRKKLAEARNVYTTPGAGENAQNANCSAVYKNVKDFVEACKGSYVLRYQSLYNAAHVDAFNREYPTTFKSQIDLVFASELVRLYPVYLKEATAVGKDVGVAVGKKEVYQQSFARSENASYAGNLPAEVARVENEAINLVQDHLNQNSALTLKGAAKVTTTSEYGISPSADMNLKMLIKNIGSAASTGNSLVRITDLSSNVTLDRREAPLAPVAAKSHAELSVMNLRVSDSAVPGSKIVVAGQIVHPGNHYRSSRVEEFRIESEVKINPSVEAAVVYDTTPNVTVILVTKKHDVTVTLKPKFAGVDRGYETTLEEIDSKHVELVTKPSTTEVLGRGVAKKVTFTYKLNKAAKGKTINLRLSVKNGGKVVMSQDLQIKAQ